MARQRELKIRERVYAFNAETNRYVLGHVANIYENGDVLISSINDDDTFVVENDLVYQICPDYVCDKGDGFEYDVCYEHNKTMDDYPYFCPAKDENFFKFELKKVKRYAIVMESIDETEGDYDVQIMGVYSGKETAMSRMTCIVDSNVQDAEQTYGENEVIVEHKDGVVRIESAGEHITRISLREV